MEFTVEENRKLKKVMVFLLELYPETFLRTKKFSLFCKYFDIEDIAARYYPQIYPDGWAEPFLFNLLLHIYKERPEEFTAFILKFVDDISEYNNVPYNVDTIEAATKKSLIQFGFTHDEIYGKKQIPIIDNKNQETESPSSETAEFARSKNIFIVHGHDWGLKEKVARFVTNAGFNPIILHEQANSGRSILQKLRDHSEEVGYAIVIVTPDDVGCDKEEWEKTDGSIDCKTRARQNVIFELGFFLGLLEDKSVCVIHKDVEEIPTDYKGIAYIPYDKGDKWKTDLLKELDAIGYEIDYKKALR